MQYFTMLITRHEAPINNIVLKFYVSSLSCLFLSALLSLAALKKKHSRRQTKVSKDKDDEPSGNSQLRALEAHMLKLSKQGKITLLLVI